MIPTQTTDTNFGVPRQLMTLLTDEALRQKTYQYILVLEKLFGLLGEDKLESSHLTTLTQADIEAINELARSLKLLINLTDEGVTNKPYVRALINIKVVLRQNLVNLNYLCTEYAARIDEGIDAPYFEEVTDAISMLIESTGIVSGITQILTPVIEIESPAETTPLTPSELAELLIADDFDVYESDAMEDVNSLDTVRSLNNSNQWKMLISKLRRIDALDPSRIITLEVLKSIERGAFSALKANFNDVALGILTALTFISGTPRGLRRSYNVRVALAKGIIRAFNEATLNQSSTHIDEVLLDNVLTFEKLIKFTAKGYEGLES